MLKKILINILLLFLVPGISYAYFVNVVKDTGLQLREGPGEDRQVVMEVAKIDPLEIAGQQNDWYRVVHWSGREGWVKRSDVAASQTVVVKVKRRKVNFRRGPGTGYAEVANLFQGSIIKVLERRRSWLKGELIDPPTGEVGWIKNTLIWGL